MRIIDGFILMLVAAGTSACTIVPPKISITGEKTVIERQITGEYLELETDAWVVSSVKTLSAAKGESAAGAADEELMSAINVRSFHSGKIERYKREGVVGENAKGFIAYRATSVYEKNKREKDILTAVIKNENNARLTVFKRTLFLRNKIVPTQEEINAFGISFAAEQREAAAEGSWIQNTDGKWIQK